MSNEIDAAVTLRYDLTRAIRETLGLPESVAVPMADHLAIGLSQRMGGLYIPKRDLRTERDDAIRRDFTGANHREVMAKYRISRATLYRTIARKRSSHGSAK